MDHKCIVSSYIIITPCLLTLNILDLFTAFHICFMAKQLNYITLDGAIATVHCFIYSLLPLCTCLYSLCRETVLFPLFGISLFLRFTFISLFSVI